MSKTSRMLYRYRFKMKYDSANGGGKFQSLQAHNFDKDDKNFLQNMRKFLAKILD